MIWHHCRFDVQKKNDNLDLSEMAVHQDYKLTYKYRALSNLLPANALDSKLHFRRGNRPLLKTYKKPAIKHIQCCGNYLLTAINEKV